MRSTWSHNRRPQQHAAPLAADSDIGKVQCGERTVGQHSAKRLARRAARPAGHTETDQADAAEAAHHIPYADDLSAEQKPNHDRRVRQQGEPRGRLGCGSDMQNISLEDGWFLNRSHRHEQWMLRNLTGENRGNRVL